MSVRVVTVGNRKKPGRITATPAGVDAKGPAFLFQSNGEQSGCFETTLPLPDETPVFAATTAIQTACPQPSSESAPDIVKAVYTVDLEILKIHEAVAARFSSQSGAIPKMRTEIEELKVKLNRSCFSPVEHAGFRDRVKTLTTDIAALESGERWNLYITAALPVLEKYIPLQSDETKGIISIAGRKDAKSEDSSIVKQRVELIQQYLSIAGGYITIDVIWQGEVLSKCPSCGRLFSDMHVDEDTGVHICECGYERENLSMGSSFKDTNRVGIGGRDGYKDRDTFLRAMQRFEGKSGDKIPELLYEQLDKYFTSKAFPPGEKIRQLPLDAEGYKQGTSVDLLIVGLKETQNATFYNVVNLVGHHYWGWVLPDLSSIRDGIMEDYDLTQPIYNRVKTRDSSLNVNIRLYAHLRARKYKCSLKNFKLVGGRDSLEYHERMLQIMRTETGVDFPHII